jgi:uncharacterized protein (TIGR01777 family)
MQEPQNGRIILAGGSGLIGRRLGEALLAAGRSVVVLSRNPSAAILPAGATAASWDDLPGALDGADAVINLAGEGIADGRWTQARKAAIRRSRVDGTRRLVEALGSVAARPAALVNASAVGYYGGRDGAPVDESTPPGRGFLAEVCTAWEAEADRAALLGVRVVKVRTGIVLAKEGGALPRMALPARLFQGTKLGHGQQGMPWIHLDDLVAVFLRATEDPSLSGAVNATAPKPLTNESFTRALCGALHRPYMAIIPGFATAFGARLLLGEMAQALLLEGAFAYPRKLEAAGFAFRFTEAEAALADLL